MYQLVVIPFFIVLIVVVTLVLNRALSKLGTIERRKFFRVDVPELKMLDITLVLDDGKFSGCGLRNISKGGAAVTVRPPIAIEAGSMIKEAVITFLSGEEIRSPAVVRNVSMEPECNKYGIQFTNVSEVQSRIIDKLMLRTETNRT